MKKMKKRKTTILEKIDFLIFGGIINFFYPHYFRPKYGYQKYYLLFFHYLIPQKIFRLNPSVKWPVHFTSKVICPENIKKGILCDPGDNLNNYIQAKNGIQFGNNIELGPSVNIISSNHSPENLNEHLIGNPIVIGDNVWIGSNAVILPEVHIGNNVIIGAGSVVSKNIPSNSIAVGNPCKVIKPKEPLKSDWYSTLVFNQKPPVDQST